MGWGDFVDSIGDVFGNIGDAFGDFGDLNLGDFLGDVGDFIGNNEDFWTSFGNTVLDIGSVAMAFATGGIVPGALAGLDLLGVSDSVIASLGLTPDQEAAMRAAREAQRRAWLQQLQTGGNSGAPGAPAAPASSGMGMVVVAVGAAILVSK